MIQRSSNHVAGCARPERRRPSANSTGEGLTMRRLNFPALLCGALTLGIMGCDFLDPSNISNPTVTEDKFVQNAQAAAVWVAGVERQLATTINQVVMGAEVVSDNVFNNRTLFSKVFDLPRIEPEDFDVTNIQQEIHRLRTMANVGLDKVLPADPAATDELRAQLYFHRGFASLLAGENFVGMPGEPEGPVLSPADHFGRAIADFDKARTLSASAEMKQAALLGIARAHYYAGNRQAAVTAAQEVKTAAPNLLRTVKYDVTNGPTNQMQFAIFDSGQGEFQPLPRLDFLFPKYYSASSTDQKPIAILKGEESFLILAEASIATGDLGEARARLGELLDLVAARPRAMVNDKGQQRGRNGGTWIFPNSANIKVAASPDDEPRAGLVLTRSGGPVSVPTVSGTSVTAAMLAAATSDVELLELLYLMRQEIFVLEGRRMADLGIRLPVAYREVQINPNVELGSAVTKARIPEFIPLDLGLDRFTYSDGDTVVTIHHNMNRVLVANRTSDAVLPFH